jgi:hypothetical protein
MTTLASSRMQVLVTTVADTPVYLVLLLARWTAAAILTLLLVLLLGKIAAVLVAGAVRGRVGTLLGR